MVLYIKIGFTKHPYFWGSPYTTGPELSNYQQVCHKEVGQNQKIFLNIG